MLSSCRYHIREGEQVQRLLHHGESKEAEGVQAEHCHHRCVLLQKSCSQCLKITLTLSVGPLGDQIVRGEMAAPTGRSKDRTRMDEDEVSSSWLKWCFNAKMFLVVFQYVLKWWNVVLQFLALVPLLVLIRKTNRTVHWLVCYRSMFGNYFDLSFSHLF